MSIEACCSAPMLPPAFRAGSAADPWQAALDAAAGGAEAGTLFHAPLGPRCAAAVVLAPEGPVPDGLVARLAGVALREALCGVLPPHAPVTLLQDRVRVNGADAAALRVMQGPGWAVLGFDIAVALQMAEPGLTPWRTDLREGGSEAGATQVLETVCRHLLAWIDEWQECGDEPIDAAWRLAVEESG